MRLIFTVVLAIALTACATHSPLNGRTPIDQVPMYGGMDRSTVAQLKTADDNLIVGTTKEFGSREKASAAFVERGFRLYQQDDLVGAMRRFNQAWILNPNNSEVYWGFASVLQDQGKNCEAMVMIDKSLAFGQYITGLYPDAGRIIVLCTMSDSRLTPDQKKMRFEKSEALYTQAAKKDVNKGYVFSSWATAYYWRGQYAAAWSMVTKAREAGEQLPDRFLSMLREKMPEPSAR